jgi:hypothetical protein
VINDDHEEISKLIKETEERKGKGKGKRRNSYYLRCSTIGRMKKKREEFGGELLPTYLP